MNEFGFWESFFEKKSLGSFGKRKNLFLSLGVVWGANELSKNSMEKLSEKFWGGNINN